MRELRLSSSRRLERRGDVQVLDFLVEKSLTGQECRGRLLRLVDISSSLLQRHYHMRNVTLSIMSA